VGGANFSCVVSTTAPRSRSIENTSESTRTLWPRMPSMLRPPASSGCWTTATWTMLIDRSPIFQSVSCE